MKTVLLLIALFHLVLSYSYSENTGVFFINITDQSADIRLGDESNPAYYINGISPYSATGIKTLLKTGKFRINYKSSDNDDWKFWIDKNKNAKVLSINDGDLFCILLSDKGDIGYYKLKEPEGKGAFVCFLNLTGEKLKKMSVAGSMEDESEISVNNIDTKTMTNFGSIKEGAYAVYWQTNDQSKNDYHTIKDDDGNDKEFNFKKRNYYICVIFKKDDVIYALCNDISH